MSPDGGEDVQDGATMRMPTSLCGRFDASQPREDVGNNVPTGIILAVGMNMNVGKTEYLVVGNTRAEHLTPTFRAIPKSSIVRNLSTLFRSPGSSEYR